MELQGTYGSIALWVDANAGVCATGARAPLWRGSELRAAAFAGPARARPPNSTRPPPSTHGHQPSTMRPSLQNAPQRSDLTEASSSGRALGADTETDFLSDEQKAAYLDGIEQGLGRLYAPGSGRRPRRRPRISSGPPRQALGCLCLPDAHFDAPRRPGASQRARPSAPQGGHGHGARRCGRCLRAPLDVCGASPSGARHLAERDELARLRRRLIAPRGPRDAWGCVGSRCARRTRPKHGAIRPLKCSKTWERAVSDEAAVRRGEGLSPWRTAHERHALDPRESASVIDEQMERGSSTDSKTHRSSDGHFPPSSDGHATSPTYPWIAST